MATPDRTRPHVEIHHEPDGWHADAVDSDPVHGYQVFSTVAVTFAAALAWVDLLKRVLK